MTTMSRRTLLGSLGSGVLLGGLGLTLAEELEILRGLGEDGARIDFGEREELVALMQDIDADDLLPKLVERLKKGETLASLVTAGSLANVRSFGGEDYVGYHCFMALLPTLAMARRMPRDQAPLPVLKVLHRNTARIRQNGGRKHELRVVETGDKTATADTLRAAARAGDYGAAESALGALVKQDRKQAYEAIQPLVRDDIDVHQVVLAWRSWDMLRLAGDDSAYLMMRQTVRQCIRRGSRRRSSYKGVRDVLPALMDEYRLHDKPDGTVRLSDKEFARLTECIFKYGRDDTARLVAKELARGVMRDQVGEAISAAGAHLILHDRGRTRAETNKPLGSVHGASPGVHASDAAHAWRGIASVTSNTEANASLITGAWHTAGQVHRVDKDRMFHESAREEVSEFSREQVLGALTEVVQGGDQKLAPALVERCHELEVGSDEVIAALLPFSVNSEGALHHEKYFATATTEYARTRPAFRWNHLAALARVNASGSKFTSRGYERARALYKKS